MSSWDKFIVEWNVPIWGGTGETFQFEAVLFGDGQVVMMYNHMPEATGSWSRESIGFEDQTGTIGVQIAYGEVRTAVQQLRLAQNGPCACHWQWDPLPD